MSKTLFDNRTKTKKARTPTFVVRELVDEHGMTEKAARALPVRAAFARMFAYRRKAMALPEPARKEEAARVAELLRNLGNESDPCANELTNAVVEGLALIPTASLKRVCLGLANLLAETAA